MSRGLCAEERAVVVQDSATANSWTLNSLRGYGFAVTGRIVPSAGTDLPKS